MSEIELVFAPSDFVAVTNQTFEHAMPYICIEGELAEFKIRKNQWLYFKIKDDYASVDCFGTVYMLPGPLEDGMKVRIAGRPKLHEKFGFSFGVQSIMPAGEGSIKKALDILMAKLSAEGLFEDSRKRKLPFAPERVGVITSKEGAAIGDFEKIMKARWPKTEIIVEDAFVQGDKAPESISSAITKFNKESDLVDVLVVIRGGGSAEDLSAFNDERLVRAVAGSRIPTLVAVGHEDDVCLAELAADLRSSTPSSAAEVLVPDIAAELKELESKQLIVNKLIIGFKERLAKGIDQDKEKLKYLYESLFARELGGLNQYRTSLKLLDPRQVMKRGFVIVKVSNGSARSAKAVAAGDKVSLLFYDGTKHATIDS